MFENKRERDNDAGSAGGGGGGAELKMLGLDVKTGDELA